MRKFLAALLAVMMLAAMIIPAAAEGDPRIGVDGSVAANADEFGLIITEYLSDSTATGVDKMTTTANAGSLDAFTYIELYNRSDATIDLYDYSIARSYIYSTTADINTWQLHQAFDQKMKLVPGSIYEGVGVSDDREETAPCQNPGTANLGAGKFAIVWFWTDATVNVAKRWIADNGNDATLGVFGGRNKVTGSKYNNLFHAGFRQHYASATGKEIPDDTLIIAVYAGSASNPRFSLTKSSNTMYGLIEDPSDNFDVKAEKIYTHDNVANTYTFNSKVKMMWSWGTGDKAGLLAAEGNSTAYVPANSNPVIYNRDQQRQLEAGQTYTPVEDYVQIGHVDSYRQAAAILSTETPTPGAMESWQWAIIDPARVPTGAGNENVTGYVASTATGWEAAVLDAFAKNRRPDLEAEPESDEEKINIELLTREEIEAMLNSQINVKKVEPKKGMPVWALILIIAGGVVVAAGIAVAVIIILKKKKAVAADDVAAEGDVVVIDETEEKTEE